MPSAEHNSCGHTACAKPYGLGHRYFCRCHERMGNDFYFLPSGSCISDGSAPERAQVPIPVVQKPEPTPEREPELVCEVCGSTTEIVRTMAFDLCPGCMAALHEEHEIYAASQHVRKGDGG